MRYASWINTFDRTKSLTCLIQRLLNNQMKTSVLYSHYRLLGESAILRWFDYPGLILVLCLVLMTAPGMAGADGGTVAWNFTGSMNSQRIKHTATLLLN